MLKNVNNTLPLKAPKNIGVFGNDAGDLTNGLYSLGGLDLAGGDYEYGVLAVAGGSGTGRLTYVVPPLDAIKARAAQDGSLVQYILNNTLVNAGDFSLIYPTPPDVCIVFLKTWATEGFDRTSLLVDWNGTALVETVAASCSNTVVVTHSGGLNTLPFANNPNVTAILAAHLGGQEVGNSLVDVLYGAVNPSGHLPYTIALDQSDYAFADITNSTALLETENPDAWQSDFKERLLIDYKQFGRYADIQHHTRLLTSRRLLQRLCTIRIRLRAFVHDVRAQQSNSTERVCGWQHNLHTTTSSGRSRRQPHSLGRAVPCLCVRE